MSVPVLYLVYAKEPVMIRHARVRVGFTALTLRVPGPSIGGALAAKGLLSQSEVVAGRAGVADAYPVLGGGEAPLLPTMPAPPCCLRLKTDAAGVRAGRVLCFPDACASSNPGSRLAKIADELSKATGLPMRTLLRHVVEAPVACPDAPISIAGVKALVCKQARTRGFWRDSVTVSTAYGRAEEGMLFSYEAVLHELWWGVAMLSSKTVARLRECVTVTLGGGRGRGFGKAVIVAEPVDEKAYVDALPETYEWMMLWSPLPTLNPVAGAVTVGTTILASWGRQSPRPILEALAPGSLVKPVASVDPVKARFLGLAPPHGSAEPVPASLQPPTLVLARKLLPDLVGKAAACAGGD